jgi:hypothetical protein
MGVKGGQCVRLATSPPSVSRLDFYLDYFMRLKIITIFNYGFDSTKKADRNSDLVQFRFLRDRIYLLLPARPMGDHTAESLFQES